MHVKKGMTVKVISGNSKGMEGKILYIFSDTQRVIVEGINFMKILCCQLLVWMKFFISVSDHFWVTFRAILWRCFFLNEFESPHFRTGIL
mgnify:CR=1 FL=1